MKLRKWLRDWLFASEEIEVAQPKLGTANAIDVDQGTARIHINKAMNGYIVQVLTYKHNPHGPDWTGDIVLVPEGADLMEAIRVGLVAKAIK